MPRFRILVAAFACVALSAAGNASASGSIVFDSSPGTSAPPATLGPYAMTPFDLDPQPYGFVDSVAGPNGTSVSFSPSLYHVRVEDGWNTWSHGYLGDVYETFDVTSTTLTLPPGTSAFSFYAEPDPYAVFAITAVAQDGTSSGPIDVDGFHGARYFGFYGTGGDAIARIVVSSDIDFAVGEFTIGGGAPRARGSIVALGDSYSSGEGDPPFFAGTDGNGDYCHRSPDAYAEVLAGLYASPLQFWACSGAKTSDITSTFHYTEPPQIQRPGVDASADLLTMTIGGNDAGFSNVLKACIEQKLKADFINAALPDVVKWLGFGKDPSCAHSDSFVSSVGTAVDNTFWPVKSTELDLLKKVDPVDTSIVVADYPLIFPASHDDQNCLELKALLTNDDMDFFNATGNRLDALLQQAAGEAGVNFVDVRSAFAGHEVCGPDGAYINGLSIASGNSGTCTWSVAGHCVIPGLPISGSFHPNPSGHANGYAAAIASYIAAAPAKTRSGFPANPAPLPDPPATTATPADGFADLLAVPVTSGSSDCAGTFQAGQRVTVSGGGFAPGADVRVYATSPGFGSGAEALVAVTTAGQDGHVETELRLPLAATGFTQQGASAGLAFVDAIGIGSAASHQDDVAAIGLGPHDGPCGTVEELPFTGFDPPVANAPQVNAAEPGRAVPVKFSLPGNPGALADAVAAGYPQSAPVPCAAPGEPTTGDTAVSAAASSPSQGDRYTFVWKTDSSWRGCRALIVKLVDGTYHHAVFDFGS